MRQRTGGLAFAVGLVLGLATNVLGATERDMTGREVTLTVPARRVVSLVPSITETLYVLGADEILAGVTTFCDHPAAARTKPKVGGIVNPSFEAIVGLRPDLVLATTEGNRDATVKQLEDLRIPTYVVSPKSFPGVLDSIARIGRLTGREAAATDIIASFRRRAARVVEATRGRPRPRVLYVVSADPLVVPGRDTLLTDLVRMAGGESVSGAESIAWPRLSLEEVVARAPEVIVVASWSAGHVDAALRRWRETQIVMPALKTGRVHTLDADILHRPGPRIVDGLEALARVIHPGALP